jgi:hypothetical protein
MESSGVQGGARQPRTMKTLPIAAVLALAACSSTPPTEPGFTSLFNGQDLTGWIYGKDGKADAKSGAGYRVRDGVLYCTKEDGGKLYTVKEYANFVFRFEFRLTPNANNGIGIRAPLEGDPAYVGMEIQVLDDSGSAYANLRPSQYHGSIYDVVAAKRGALRPVEEWNEEEILAEGDHVRVTVNGVVVVDARLSDVKDPAILTRHPGLTRKSGHIGFLGHGAEVEFRGMRIRELGRSGS